MINEVQGQSGNLLNAKNLKYLQAAPSSTPVISPKPQVAVIQQPAQDVFIAQNPAATESKKSDFKEIIQKYSGAAALAVSAIGFPVIYIASKKSGKKIDTKIDNLVKSKVDEAVKGFIQKTDDVIARMTQASGLDQTVPKKADLWTKFSAIVAVGGTGGLTAYVATNKDKLKEKYSDEEINNTQLSVIDKVNNDSNTYQMANNAQNTAHNAMNTANHALGVAYDAKNIAHGVEYKVNDAFNNARAAMIAAENSLPTITSKYLEKFKENSPIKLLIYPDYEKIINKDRTGEVINSVRNASIKRNSRSAKDTLAEIENYKNNYPKLESLWQITSEYAPIKTGGLGVVPVDLQNNFEKLGINNTTFVPMYLNGNSSEYFRNNGNYTYIYDNKIFDLRKIAELPLEVYREGEHTSKKVEYFLSEVPLYTKEEKEKEPVKSSPYKDLTKQIVFVKCDDYFKNGGIYNSTTTAEETERFAVFDKAVYQLAKIKVNQALGNKKIGLSNFNITDKEAYHKLKAPNSMILNDWHAGSLAGLMRYRAPFEYNYNKLESNTYNALKNMPLLMIGHNLGCQGKTNDGTEIQPIKDKVTENVINTLYDNYAKGIVENALSGIDNADMWNTLLMKSETEERHFNHLFNGVALSDWFVPVSENYTTELLDPNHKERAGILFPLLEMRKEAGTFGGIINGLDKELNDMNALRAGKNHGYVTDAQFKPYDKNTPIKEILEVRKQNKEEFYDKFINPILNGTYKAGKIPGVIWSPDGNDKTKEITKKDFVDAPLISFAHRLTDQKGLQIFEGAVNILFDNWEKDFPGKTMPYFLVGGSLDDAGHLKYLESLKNPAYGENKERINRVISLQGFLPNPGIMAASTFFVAPSTYEPCGLTQGEAFGKGTPIIATYTGGFVDTIYDDKFGAEKPKYYKETKIGTTGFFSKYDDGNLEANKQHFYEAMVRALKVYFDEPKKYEQMIKNDLKVDFSWAQEAKQGPIYRYMDKLGPSHKVLSTESINKIDKTTGKTLLDSNGKPIQQEYLIISEIELPDITKKELAKENTKMLIMDKNGPRPAISKELELIQAKETKKAAEKAKAEELEKQGKEE